MYTSPPNTSVTIHMDRGDWVSLTFDFFFFASVFAGSHTSNNSQVPELQGGEIKYLPL